MQEVYTMKNDIEKITDIIRDAGGKIVGRTRLQKIACLLELAGLGEGFHFVYHHYGPYCEEVAWATDTACMMKMICEDEERASWGGLYSIYSLPELIESDCATVRMQLAQAAAKADTISLELAVTAAYFAANGKDAPWEEVEIHKPDKTKEGRLDGAKKLYKKLRLIANTLPEVCE